MKKYSKEHKLIQFYLQKLGYTKIRIFLVAIQHMFLREPGRYIITLVNAIGIYTYSTEHDMKLQ